MLPLPSPGRTYISNIAEVTVRAIQPGDAFVIVACDGLWDELSNHEVRACASLPCALKQLATATVSLR